MSAAEKGVAVLRQSETIVAVATAGGRGALAVLRVSGPGAFAVCGACIAEKEKFAGRGAWRSGLYTVVDPQTGRVIDHVTAVKFVAPRSFTGEDMVEVTTHGGTVVPGLVLDALCRAGGVIAEPGEFSRRAVLAGKMDLLSAEAVNALVCASEEEECERALRAGGGVQRRAVEELESELRGVAAELEGQIECGTGDGMWAGVRERLWDIRCRLEREVENWERSRRGDGGVEIVIAGVANAGKSTLFNLLVGAERAMVDQEPGTTRDWLCENVRFGGVRVRLVDTAGLGVSEGGGGIAARSVGRSREKIESAGGIIWVCPMDRVGLTEEERWLLGLARERLVAVVLSKWDRGVESERRRVAEGCGVKACAGNLLCESDRRRIWEEISSEVVAFARRSMEKVLVVNERQAGLIRGVSGLLGEVLRSGWPGEEIVAAYVRRAMEGIAGMRVQVQEEVLDEVFGRFCVGK